jgi:pSer/pThr/pTyr-binding forkhead associated (FHA) protein
MGRALGYEESMQPVTAAEMPALTCLVVLQGARRGQRIQLTNGAVPLGRLDLDPADTGISRQHANVIFRGGSHWLQDTSKNGTWVDNQRVYGEVPLRTGSVIMIGDNVLRLETRRE